MASNDKQTREDANPCGGASPICPPKSKFEDGNAVFEMGEHTLRVPVAMHRHNRERVRHAVANAASPVAPAGSIILLQGGEDTSRYSSDMENIFRQESYFHWAFGVLEPGFYGAFEVASGRTTLFCPRLPAEYAVWMGRITTPAEFAVRYQVDRVAYVDEISDVLQELEPSSLLTLRGVNSDSGSTTLEAAFEGISRFNVNNQVLHDVMAECRVTKSEAELQILRFAARVSSDAHRAVMRQIRPGMREYQLESIFRHHSYYFGGCRHQCYTSICGSGASGAVLHYGHAGAPNARTVEDGDMCLFDMGSEYYCYTSDITCSFPANGRFTADQRLIYEAVLAASRAVFAEMAPGVSWVQLHAVANRAMLSALRDGQLVHGHLEEMMNVNLASVFQPHGLGHLLGLDVHDVGGYLPLTPQRPTRDGFCSLRTARLLEPNMVITIEPGCYFIDALLDRALADPERSRFLNAAMLARFRGFGGVRIEDDVVVTADGVENMTTVPRTVEDIEALMAAGREQEDVVVPQLVAKSKRDSSN